MALMDGILEHGTLPAHLITHFKQKVVLMVVHTCNILQVVRVPTRTFATLGLLVKVKPIFSAAIQVEKLLTQITYSIVSFGLLKTELMKQHNSINYNGELELTKQPTLGLKTITFSPQLLTT